MDQLFDLRVTHRKANIKYIHKVVPKNPFKNMPKLDVLKWKNPRRTTKVNPPMQATLV